MRRGSATHVSRFLPRGVSRFRAGEALPADASYRRFATTARFLYSDARICSLITPHAAGLTEPTWLSPWLLSARTIHVMCVGLDCRPLEVCRRSACRPLEVCRR